MSRFDLTVLETAQRVPGKPRHRTREVRVGSVVYGGDNPIWVQSMTTTDTFDVDGTVKQILALEEAGCELVRVTVPKPEDAGALSRIRERIGIPLICDIHFDYKMALAALDHPVDKIRINPGQHWEHGPVPPGGAEGEGQGHPDAGGGERRQSGARPVREVRLPVPAGDGRERAAVHRGRGEPRATTT